MGDGYRRSSLVAQNRLSPGSKTFGDEVGQGDFR